MVAAIIIFLFSLLAFALSLFIRQYNVVKAIKEKESILAAENVLLESKFNELVKAGKNLREETNKLDIEQKTFTEESRKIWKMNEAIYIDKKGLEEQNEQLAIDKQKLESEKKKVEERIKKLWQQSTAIHKEKERVNAMKLEIEHRHKETVDSVVYAKRIQEAILPSISTITGSLPQSFVLFKPRDIVSGDFYWFLEKGNSVLIAAADCTGHGVPGALMSMIGANFLEQIVNEKNIMNPAEILHMLDSHVMRALKQGTAASTSRDGMDISLVSISFPGDQKGETLLRYSGANRPVYFIRNGALEQFEPVKHPIGNYSAENKIFRNYEKQLQKRDTFYLFTDGFCDQFGGEKGKRFMTKRFRELLSELQFHDIPDQHMILDKTFTDWKGDNEQLDDVLVIGIRI